MFTQLRGHLKKRFYVIVKSTDNASPHILSH